MAKYNFSSVETSGEDETLNKFMKDMGWIEVEEKLLLGRSLWRRQINS